MQDINTGTTSIAETLLSTLESEARTLERLGQTFELQLEALRNRQQDLLEQATLQANTEVSNLARLRQVRERQVRLFGRALGMGSDNASLSQMLAMLPAEGLAVEQVTQLRAARMEVHARARATHERCLALEGALQFAVQVGREMLQALQGLDLPVPSSVYNAKGSSLPTTAPRSLMNHVG